MIKSKQQVGSSSSSMLFAITLVSTLLVLGTVFSLHVLTPTSPSPSPLLLLGGGLDSQVNSIVGNFQFYPASLAYAQSTVTTLANSASGSNDTLVFNTYENSEMGISIKYPSSFLIDESNSNETVKQVSFFPAYDDSTEYPQTYISWFNVYVEDLYPPIYDSGNQINISSYLESQANSIQEQDADVTIVETSTDSMLSGIPAYKLVTRSYSGNTSIDDIEIGTLVGNKLYILNYEVNTNDVQNSLPIANKMIYSFKINSLNNLADSITKLANSSSIAKIKEEVPFLANLFSSLNIKNITSSPYSLLNSLGLNETAFSTLQSLLSNSTTFLSSPSGSLPSTNLSSLMGSGLGSVDPDTICNFQILSALCRGDVFSNHTNQSIAPFLSDWGSFGGNVSDLSQLLNLSNNTRTMGLLGGQSILGPDNATAAGEGFNLSALMNLLGPFAMLESLPSSSFSSSLSSNSSNSSSSSFPPFSFLANSSNSLFGQTGLEPLFSSSSSFDNHSDSMFLDHLFSHDGGFGFGTSNVNNSSSSSNSNGNSSGDVGLGSDLGSFNPFAILFGINGTGFDPMVGEDNTSQSLTNTSQHINSSNSSSSASSDLMKILEFLQSGQK